MLRGQTTHKARATQGRDYSGLRYGNITPTDLDGLIEFRDKAYVLIGAKLENAVMSGGQKLALERLCDDLNKIKPTLLVLVKHNTPVNQEIDFAKCNVEQYRYKGRWTTPRIVENLKKFIDSFLQSLETHPTPAR